MIIEDGYWYQSPVYNIDQIYRLFDKMKREWLEANYLKRESARFKKQKVKVLKHKAIIAKINQIAKEENIRKYVKKVKFIIYLAKAEEMEIDIPYDQFQDTLKNLCVTVQTIRELRDSGVSFQIRTYLRR
ncbi:MAG: hypothetical protein DRR08_02505 [Candidatus Parabeggiatoa sp. nov. 2]|nr:MAG: hypothetical protein B6247_04605 [Beggiatoa sp. 4572_84]RKZ63809.1 MAG: hypothetical protein DRR08_02505 [Gammaproteobacteria bacterium]